MKLTMVIPSYWGRNSNVGWKEGDAIYDHPTPLDMEGTLGRAIRSIGTLSSKDFRLVILVAATSPYIEDDVEQKVSRIVRENAPYSGVEVIVLGPSRLRRINKILMLEGKKEHTELLSLRGYSNIRNLCLFIPHILGSDAAVLIDDDEVFEDPAFIDKIKENIGKEHDGKSINALAGYYLQPDGDFHVPVPEEEWMRYWDKNVKMNEAFDTIIGKGPRIRKTPFVFGGNMTVHRDLFMKVPFDPSVPRGEDIDYLINARMFGFDFFIDSKLNIKHLPPAKSHPAWKRVREDIYRFIYEKEKLERQTYSEGMEYISANDLGAYPGSFLGSDLEEKIEKACKLLSELYLRSGDENASKECLRNIELAGTDAIPSFDPFENLRRLQKKWQQMMEFTDNESIRKEMQEIIEEKNY